VLHSTCTHWGRVGRLLVIGSQTASLTFNLFFVITCVANVQMVHARPFSTSRLWQLFNDMKNVSRWGVLTPSIELWSFASLGGLPSPHFRSKTWALTLKPFCNVLFKGPPSSSTMKTCWCAYFDALYDTLTPMLFDELQTCHHLGFNLVLPNSNVMTCVLSKQLGPMHYYNLCSFNAICFDVCSYDVTCFDLLFCCPIGYLKLNFLLMNDLQLIFHF
jgi:hypothetical protein